jgi:hypothetical protein
MGSSSAQRVATLLERLHGETRHLALIRTEANGSALGDEHDDGLYIRSSSGDIANCRSLLVGPREKIGRG